MRWRWHWLYVALAAIGISLAATGVLVLTRPGSETTLLIYLPGIAVVEALFGLWGGVAAVLLSVGGSTATRMWFLQNPLQTPVGFYASWQEELILLLVGMFVVVLMELRRRSGERVASGAHQLSTLMENIADAVVIFTPDLRVAAMNPAARRVLNRPEAVPNAPAGLSLERLQARFQFTDVHGEPPQLPFEEAMRRGLPIREEGVLEDAADGHRMQVLASFAPWRDARGRVAGAVVLITDVTPLKELQQRALDNARHLALAQMISGLTHDFNHVLDIVRRANAVLEMQGEASNAERRKYRAMIDRAARDGSEIVRRLREYLAGGTGATGPVDLAQAARQAIELTSPLWRTRREIELIEDLTPVPAVRGNLNDLRRVLTNLIFNAVEALDPAGGKVIVRTSASRDRRRVCATVEDTGRGVPPEVQSRMFEPYVTSKPHGMGMGLFGAQKIVLAHRGHLDFVSTPGRGTRFTLDLPALAEHRNADAA